MDKTAGGNPANARFAQMLRPGLATGQPQKVNFMTNGKIDKEMTGFFDEKANESTRNYIGAGQASRYSGFQLGYKNAEDDKIPGGKADGRPDSDFPKEEIEAGKKVEMEHTDDPELAKEITKDHLTESSEYYDELDDMEKELEAEKEPKNEVDPEAVSDFFRNNPNPVDEDFHAFAEQKGYDVHKAEQAAYALATQAAKQKEARLHGFMQGYIGKTAGLFDAFGPSEEQKADALRRLDFNLDQMSNAHGARVGLAGAGVGGLAGGLGGGSIGAVLGLALARKGKRLDTSVQGALIGGVLGATAGAGLGGFGGFDWGRASERERVLQLQQPLRQMLAPRM